MADGGMTLRLGLETLLLPLGRREQLVQVEAKERAAAAAVRQQSNYLGGRKGTEERVEELGRGGRGGGGEDAVNNGWDGFGREGAEAALERGDLTLGRRRHGGSEAKRRQVQVGIGMAGDRRHQKP